MKSIVVSRVVRLAALATVGASALTSLASSAALAATTDARATSTPTQASRGVAHDPITKAEARTARRADAKAGAEKGHERGARDARVLGKPEKGEAPSEKAIAKAANDDDATKGEKHADEKHAEKTELAALEKRAVKKDDGKALCAAQAPKTDERKIDAKETKLLTVPKPSSIPLPSYAVSATKPLLLAGTTETASRKTAHAMELEADHAVEPRRTPLVRVSTQEEAAPGPCLRGAVDVLRGEEEEPLSLTKCDGSVAPLAIEGLSILARPGSVKKPQASLSDLSKEAGEGEVAPGIKRLDPGLVERLQSIVDHFAAPGATTKVRLAAPAKNAAAGSFHASGRALDFRLEGVKDEKVIEFCKELADTGCGFYPNGPFVHVDVRRHDSGRVSWIDASKPGEAPDYVAQWPLQKHETGEDGNLKEPPAHLLKEVAQTGQAGQTGTMDKELELLPPPDAHGARTDVSSNRDWTKGEPKTADAKTAKREIETGGEKRKTAPKSDKH